MKKILFILLVTFTASSSLAQNSALDKWAGKTTSSQKSPNSENTQDKYGSGAVPVKNGVVTFTMINQVEGKSSSELFSSAKVMIAEMFKSAKDVIQSEDKDSGIIICKGNVKIVSAFLTDLMEFTLKISCKDNRYKVDLYNISLIIGYGDTNPIYQDCNKTIIDEIAIKDGKAKKTGGGKQRREVIDKKDEIFSIIKKEMEKSTPKEEEW